MLSVDEQPLAPHPQRQQSSNHLKKNTIGITLGAQGAKDSARGVLTFEGLIGNPRLGSKPRPPR